MEVEAVRLLLRSEARVGRCEDMRLVVLDRRPDDGRAAHGVISGEDVQPLRHDIGYPDLIG